MSVNYQYEKTGEDVNCKPEAILHLSDRESPLSFLFASDWTAEYVTRKVATEHVGIGCVTLEVHYISIYY